MDLKGKAEAALATLDPKSLRDAQVGQVLQVKASPRVKILFTVTSIKKGARGYVVSLRTPEGFEWGIPGVRWTGEES